MLLVLISINSEILCVYVENHPCLYHNIYFKGLSRFIIFMFCLLTYDSVEVKCAFTTTNCITFIPVWLRNRLITGGLESLLSNAKISFIASYYRHFSTNTKTKT